MGEYHAGQSLSNSQVGFDNSGNVTDARHSCLCELNQESMLKKPVEFDIVDFAVEHFEHGIMECRIE